MRAVSLTQSLLQNAWFKVFYTRVCNGKKFLPDFYEKLWMINVCTLSSDVFFI